MSFHLRYTGKGKMTIRQAQRRSPAIMELVEGKIKRRSVFGLNVVGGKTSKQCPGSLNFSHLDKSQTPEENV